MSHMNYVTTSDGSLSKARVCSGFEPWSGFEPGSDVGFQVAGNGGSKTLSGREI